VGARKVGKSEGAGNVGKIVGYIGALEGNPVGLKDGHLVGRRKGEGFEDG
jgi:hypothetical protein